MEQHAPMRVAAFQALLLVTAKGGVGTLPQRYAR